MDTRRLEVGAILEGVSIGIAVLRNRKYVLVNPAMSEISGYPEHELVGQHTGIMYARPEDFERVGLEVSNIFSKGGTYETELLIRRKDNELRWVAVSGRLISQAEPLEGSVWFMQDITERKHSAAILQIQSEIISHVEEGFCLTKVCDGTIVYANPQFERMFGYAPGEMVGIHVANVNAPTEKSPEEVATGIIASLDRVGRWEGEIYNRKKDGTPFWCDVKISTYEQSEHGKVWLSVHRDISESKEARRKILRLNALYTAISHTNQAIIRITDRNTLLQEVCRIAVEHGGFKFSWVGMIDAEGTVKVSAANGHSKGYIDGIRVSIAPDKPEGRGVTARSIREDRVCVCNDFFADDGMLPWQNSARQLGFRSSASCPLKLEGKVIGALSVYAEEPNYFDDGLTGLLDDISADISFALDNFVREGRRKQAEEELWQQKRLIHQVIDTDPNLIFVKDAEGRFLLVNQAMADLHGTTSQDLVGRKGEELFPNKAEWEPHLNADREVIETRRPVVFTALASLGGRERWLLVTKVPMEQPDGTISVLGIAVDITERKRAEEKLGEAYDKLHLMAKHMETIREEEQRRIARELHDEMGGVLAALNMNIARLAKMLPAVTPHVQAEVGSMSKLLAAAIQAMRHTVAKLRPSILDDADLRAAIETYVAEFQENTGTECTLIDTLPDELALKRDDSATLFRILQESLTNIVKHAQASRVTVILKEYSNSVVLVIRDNGKGFDLNNYDKESFGLKGMRERASMIGGNVRIKSGPGRGTSVWVSVPVCRGSSLRDSAGGPVWVGGRVR